MALKIIIATAVVIFLMVILASGIALAFVRDYQKYTKNGE